MTTTRLWRQISGHRCSIVLEPTARTQPSNGLAERVIAVVEEILRCFVSYSQDDWEDLLPMLMFVINNQVKDSISGYSPMQVELAITPILPVDLINGVAHSKAKALYPAASTDTKSAAAQRIEF